MFSVRPSNKAEKQVKQLETKLRSRVLHLFSVLEQNPVPAQGFDLVKVAGREDSYRIRLSSHRVVYTVFWEEKIVRIVKVERRSETTYTTNFAKGGTYHSRH